MEECIDLTDGTAETKVPKLALDAWLEQYFPDTPEDEKTDLRLVYEGTRISFVKFCETIKRGLDDPEALEAYGGLLTANKTDHAKRLGITPQELHELGPIKAKALGSTAVQGEVVAA